MTTKNKKTETCCCLEFVGDNDQCPIHGDMYPESGYPRGKAAPEKVAVEKDPQEEEEGRV